MYYIKSTFIWILNIGIEVWITGLTPHIVQYVVYTKLYGHT